MVYSLQKIDSRVKVFKETDYRQPIVYEPSCYKDEKLKAIEVVYT